MTEPRNERIVIQTPTRTQGANGEVTETFQDYISRWAYVEVSTGREFREASTEQTKEKVTFRVHRDTEVQTNWRIKWGKNADGSDRFWDIESAPPPRRFDERLIHCTARVL